jgi:enoyl-[acyl-carrier-protein] reductase (NADH)
MTRNASKEDRGDLTPAAGSYTNDLFKSMADASSLSGDDWFASMAQSTMLKRLPTLSEVAETAAFLASDRAGAMTGTIANLTSGALTE